MQSLSDRLVVVTGAASGIGRATALSCTRAGARLALADLDEDGCTSTREAAERLGGKAASYAVDVASARAMEEFAAAVLREHGVPDMVVNNAGIGLAGPLLHTTLADWERLLGINLWGVIHGCRLFAPAMVERGHGGHIVNVASAAAFAPSRILPAYATSKAAVLMLSECLRAELAPHHVGVTAVCPGLINTNIVRTAKYVGGDGANAERRKRAALRLYQRRNYTPERVAEHILEAVRSNRAVLPVTIEAHALRLIARLFPGWPGCTPGSSRYRGRPPEAARSCHPSATSHTRMVAYGYIGDDEVPTALRHRASMNTGVQIGRVAGIRIRAHWSVLVIGTLLAWGLADGIIPVVATGTPAAVAWIMGSGAAVLLITSLTAHELGHALLARRRGVAVQEITLWLFGGIARLSGDWAAAKTELMVAAIGPAITVVLVVIFGGIAVALAYAGAPPLVLIVPQWLATVNLMLLVFNLIPAFPLDGGRILRAALWLWRKDRSAATVTAARVGRGFGFLLVALGFVELFLTPSLGGFWLVLIGWYLSSQARGEERSELARHALEGVRVADAMSREPVRVPSWITVELLIEQFALRYHVSAFPTHTVDGRIEGLVTLRGIRRVPANQRSQKRARDIAIPIDQVPVARPDELLTDLLERMGPGADGRALVFDGDQLVGIISPSDIVRLLQPGPGNAIKRSSAA